MIYNLKWKWLRRLLILTVYPIGLFILFLVALCLSMPASLWRDCKNFWREEWLDEYRELHGRVVSTWNKE